MNLINNAYKWYLQFRLKEIEHLMKNPIASQERVFHELIDSAKETVWGREHDYASIKTLEDFQARVQISEYETFEPYIMRMMAGEADVLHEGLVKNFSKSSGTTARSKHIPVTEDLLSDMYKAGRDELAFYLQNNPETEVLRGKSIFVGGSLEKIKEEPEIYSGDVSAIIMKNLPALGEHWRTPSLATAMMAEFEEKLERMAEETMNENVTSIAGVPTWTIALIKKVLEKTSKTNIHEVWPNLEVFFHGAVSFEPYRKVFATFAPKRDMHYIEAYNASEGFFAIQDDPMRLGEMWLAPDYGVFYEFVPMSEFGKDGVQVFTMADVKLGINYAMIISTKGGLARYAIGDTIIFTNLFPHRIKITGRTKHFINTFGEEVMVHNTDKALKEACEKTGALLTEYTVAPVFMGDGKSACHEWVVEFESSPSDLRKFKFELDLALRKTNSDYDAKRHKDIILRELVLHVAPKGTFYKWMKSRGKLGGQNKVPRLSNSREYLEGVLSFL